jgi:hypothetical protein
MIRRVQDVHIFGTDDPGVRDRVPKDAVARREHKRISHVHATQRSEDGVPMTRDADVSALPGECRVLDVSRGSREGPLVAAFEDRRGELDRRRFEARHPAPARARRVSHARLTVGLAGKLGGDRRRFRDGHASVILRPEDDEETPEREYAAGEKEHPLEPPERGVTDIRSHGRRVDVDAAKYPGRVRTENLRPFSGSTATRTR